LSREIISDKPSKVLDNALEIDDNRYVVEDKERIKR
tara:strand:- start:1384 stop:1491 length:108 start_codon:yes stop_codon:yes gene_type:complete